MTRALSYAKGKRRVSFVGFFVLNLLLVMALFRYWSRSFSHALSASFASCDMKVVRRFPVLVVSPRMLIIAGVVLILMSFVVRWSASCILMPEELRRRKSARALVSPCWSISLSWWLVGMVSCVCARVPFIRRLSFIQNFCGISISFSRRNILTAASAVLIVLGGFPFMLMTNFCMSF